MWRGTQEIYGWVLNFQGLLVPFPLCDKCKVHLGFVNAYNSVKDYVHDHIDKLLKLHPTAKIAVTGHSLGAALATISALDLQDLYNGIVA